MLNFEAYLRLQQPICVEVCYRHGNKLQHGLEWQMFDSNTQFVLHLNIDM